MKHMTEQEFERQINIAYRKGVNMGFEKASNYAVGCMLAVPLIVLHDHFNEIRRKEFAGKSRTEHFFDLCKVVYEKYNTGDDILERLLRDVQDKTGFNISGRIIDGE